jgi:hypothetical protein
MPAACYIIALDDLRAAAAKGDAYSGESARSWRSPAEHGEKRRVAALRAYVAELAEH